ncbi:MAG: M1 family aminopeptidase, partial [Acidimicrobiales bacterium]
DDLAPVFAAQGDMLAYFATVFGPYPFAIYGALVTNGLGGLDFEAQTMSLFGGAVDEEIVAHELVHQWFGDSVSVRSWDAIWLAEGFATFGSWLWEEHQGGRTTAQRGRQARRPDLGPIRDPGLDGMFDDNVYNRGALTLEALRETIGDDAFFRTLSTYAARFRGGNVTTDDFIAVAEQVSGRPLASFFASWLDDATPPELT